MRLQKFLLEHDIDHDFVHWGGSLIPYSRNELANYFLGHPKPYTHYISLDSDVLFKAEDVVRLILHKVEFVGGQYPWKCLLEDKKPRAYEVSSLEPCMGYPVNPLSPDHPKKKDEFVRWGQGLVSVASITTGFQVLQRGVFERLRNYFDGRGSDSRKYAGDHGVHYDFFGNRPRGSETTYLHEDQAFCQDYLDAGGTIFFDVTVGLGHEGMFVYDGLPMERLMRGEPISDGWFTLDKNRTPVYRDQEK